MTRSVLSRSAWVLALLCGLACYPGQGNAQPPEGYYDSVDNTSSSALRSSLHEIIDDHQRFPYTSDETDTWDVLEEADEDPANDRRIITIYSNTSYAKQGGGNNSYNREHVWPKSYGYPNNDESVNYPYTDMHSLFLSDSDYNYVRSNSPFNVCADNCVEYPTDFNDGRGGQGGGYPGDSNWQTGEFTQGRWEAWDGRKGDVARALMYMDVRYEGGTHGITDAMEPDLILTDNLQLIDDSRTGENESTGYMGMLSVLLDWHRQDPVDATEMRHHEAVAANQGNRNPFIDHPEWVTCVFEHICSTVDINGGMTDAWFNGETQGQGFFITVWEQSGLIFVSWFTYDSERPPEGIEAVVGEPGHRWYTAQGAYSGDTAQLDIYLSQGGVFNQAQPAVGPAEQVGTMEIFFTDCGHGTIRYTLVDQELMSEIAIERIVSDNLARCEQGQGNEQ